MIIKIKKKYEIDYCKFITPLCENTRSILHAFSSHLTSTFIPELGL